MLQKPSRKSKARDHAKYLTTRLERWRQGNLTSLMDECQEIQKRLVKSRRQELESKEKAFCRLMLLGKVRQASKYINNDDCIKGVHKLSNDIKSALSLKHPKAEETHPDVMMPTTRPVPNPVMYEQITADVIVKSAKNLSGSGGPTAVDADIWKHFICSRSYGNHPHQLADAIAGMARRFCSEEIHFDMLREYTACRLVPLDKGADKSGKPGIRPIGIGEVLRRIIGKSVMTILKSDVQTAGGCLQTCTGLRSGIEAAIHACHDSWQEQTTECLLQVDAENAFNRLNRKVALNNIKQICPPIHRFLHNHYQQPSKLTLSDENSHDHLFSEEGCTQGDPAAMGFYSLGTKPLIDALSDCVDTGTCKQSWFADDSSAVGKLRAVRSWWERLITLGPKYGYYPKPSKTILILKDAALMSYAKSLFAGTGIKITCQGQRHLGAVIGDEESRNQYVSIKVAKWVKDLEDLAKIACYEPQIALSAYTKSICHRWTFVQRTIPHTSNLFQPLEEAIKDTLIPSILGRAVNDVEREILSLPVRYGGLGIANPVENSDREYSASKRVTRNLASLIVQQQNDLSFYDHEGTMEIIKDLKKEKETFLTSKYNRLMATVSDESLRRCLELNKDKGAGSWLTALPLKDLGYWLNKQEFRDAICLRYCWKIPNTPPFCGCGAKMK